MIIKDYDGTIHTSKVAEPATISSIQILNRLREIKAARCHMKKVREDIWRTNPTIPKATVPESINDVASTEQMGFNKEGENIRATMMGQSGRETPRAV